MNVVRLAVCALVALAAAGCRSGGNQELIERELRFQETELWRLRDEIDTLSCQLEMAQRENTALKRGEENGSSGDSIQSPPSGKPRDLPSPLLESPFGQRSRRNNANRPNNSSERVPSEPEAPQIDLGPPSEEPAQADGERPIEEVPNEFTPPGELPSPPTQQSPELPAPGELRDGRRAGSARQASHTTAAQEGKPARLVILKESTGGRDHDGKPGHEGITLGFEPRGVDGQLVRSKGDVSIVVLDPANNGAEARVARWDFKSKEAAAHFDKGAHRGYYFDLTWSGKPPIHPTLQVFVRLVTAEGARLVADETIEIVPPTTAQTWNAARPRPAADAGPTADDGDPTLISATKSTDPRPRFFSRIKPRSAPNDAAAAAAPAGLVPVTTPEGVQVYVDPQDAAAVAALGGTADGATAAPKTASWIDRSRIRGGPGIFDGSRIRAWTGGVAKNTPGPYRADPGLPPGAIVYSPDAQPPLATGTGLPLGGGAAPVGVVANPPPWTSPPIVVPSPGVVVDDVNSPVGGPPMIADPPPGEDPPAARVSRPAWRPYR